MLFLLSAETGVKGLHSVLFAPELVTLGPAADLQIGKWAVQAKGACTALPVTLPASAAAGTGTVLAAAKHGCLLDGKGETWLMLQMLAPQKIYMYTTYQQG